MSEFQSYLTNYVFEPSMIIQNVVTTAATVILFSKKEDSTGRKIRDGAVLLVSLFLLNGLWDVLFSSPGSYFVTHLLIFLGYAAWKRDLKNKACIITAVLFYALECCLIQFSSVFPYILGDVTHGNTLDILLRNATVLMTIPAAFFYRRYSILEMRGITKVSTVYAGLIAAVTVFLGILWSAWKQSFSIRAAIFALASFAGVLVLNMLAYYLNYSMCLHSEKEKQLLVENYAAGSYSAMKTLNEQNLEDMRKIRHDLKNHFAYLDLLLKEDRYEDAKKYFGQMRENAIVPLAHIDCGNPVISGVLNLEAAKARAAGVDFDWRAVVDRTLPIPDGEMTALLTNLLDNAIEAVVRMQCKGIVEVGINQKDSQLFICVINPVDPALGKEELLSLESTKGDQENHGYGHKIVDSIVARHGGALSRKVKDGRYIVDTVLDLEAEGM